MKHIGRDKNRNKSPEELKVIEKQNLKDTYDWIESLISALVFCVVLFVFFARLIYVNGNSMKPTLFDGDLMCVSNLFFTPKQGDVVVFKKDAYDSQKALVKRVIATEGQVVNIDFATGKVNVDDVDLDEDYIAELTYNKLDFIGPQTVPEGCVFVMGDNRNQSTDSRNKLIGMVDTRLILGKAYFIIYPLDSVRKVK